MNKDLEHLRLLSIFHYVLGGLIALFSCFPLIHLFMGIMFLSGGFPKPPAQNGQPEFPVKLFGLMFTVIPLIFILGGWTLAVCTIIAGRKLAKHQSHLFCLIIAVILCVFAPFGTILGVFTIIVLLRDSVKALFNEQSPVTYGNTPPNWQ